MATEAAPSPRSDASRPTPLIAKGWVQGVALVMIFGFLVMGILAYRTYAASMPLPERVVSDSGKTLFTRADITRGQQLFQSHGLMEYGSARPRGLPRPRLHRRVPPHGDRRCHRAVASAGGG